MGERELPKGWTWTTIGDVTASVEKVDPTAKAKQQFSYLDIASIDNKTNRVTDPKSYQGSEAPSRARQLVKTDDVLFSTVRTYLRNIARVPAALDGQIASTGFAVLRANGTVLPAYIFHYCLNDDFLNALSEIQRGTSYPAVRDSDVRDQSFPLAPLPEQHRIVAKIESLFTRLDASVAALKHAQANLKRYKASVLKAACEGKLVPQDPTAEPAQKLLDRILHERRAKWEADLIAKGKDPTKAKYEEPKAPETDGLPELPEGWCWARAEQICDFITKGTTPSADKMLNGSDGIPYIKVYNLTDRGALDLSIKPTFISPETHTKDLARSCVYPGDVLMNIVGPPLGKVSIVPSTHAEWNINQAIAIFRPMPSYDRTFLAYCLLTESVLTWATRRAKATAGQFNLTLEICRDLPLPIPPLSEQRLIVAEIERRLSVVAEMEQTLAHNLARAERLRQAILKKAFEGRLVEQAPEDEPAEKMLERIKGMKLQGEQLILPSVETEKPAKKAKVVVAKRLAGKRKRNGKGA